MYGQFSLSISCVRIGYLLDTCNIYLSNYILIVNVSNISLHLFQSSVVCAEFTRCNQQTTQVVNQSVLHQQHTTVQRSPKNMMRPSRIDRYRLHSKVNFSLFIYRLLMLDRKLWIPLESLLPTQILYLNLTIVYNSIFM